MLNGEENCATEQAVKEYCVVLDCLMDVVRLLWGNGRITQSDKSEWAQSQGEFRSVYGCYGEYDDVWQWKELSKEKKKKKQPQRNKYSEIVTALWIYVYWNSAKLH